LTMPAEGVIVDLDAHKITYSSIKPLPRLPEAKKLYLNLQPYYNVLFKKQPEYQNPHTISTEQEKAAKAVLDAVNTYTAWIGGRIKSYFTSSNLKLDNTRNRELLSDAFLQTVSSQNREFIGGLLSTQHFSVYASVSFGDEKPRGT
jgi:hypothetical protein